MITDVKKELNDITSQLYIPTSLIHLHGQTVPLKRENRTTFTEGVPLHINFL